MGMIALVIMRDIHRHMDEEDLERYSSGTAAEDDVALYEEHLLACETCQLNLQETKEYLVAMQFAARQVRREGRAAEKERERSFPAWLPAFAAVACLALVMVVIMRSRSPQPAVAVSLTALRSNGSGITAPASRGLLLHPDLTGLATESSYRLEIVNQAGRRMWQGTFSPTQDGVTVPGQSAGFYFVRVYLQRGELLREYGLEIK